VLSDADEESGSYDPLDRLKMAMNYEEKKVRNAFSEFLDLHFPHHKLQVLDFILTILERV